MNVSCHAISYHKTTYIKYGETHPVRFNNTRKYSLPTSSSSDLPLADKEEVSWASKRENSYNPISVCLTPPSHKQFNDVCAEFDVFDIYLM